MSDKFDETASRWAHQGFKDSDFQMLKEENEKLRRELAEANRLFQLASSLARASDEMRDQLRAEVELFRSQLVKANRDCLDARAELRDATATDNSIKLLEKLKTTAAEMEWLWANCKVVYWPKDDRYPIEHNPHAKKYSRDMIEAEMPNAALSEVTDKA